MKTLILFSIVGAPALACLCPTPKVAKSAAAAGTIFTAKVQTVTKDRSGIWLDVTVVPDRVYKGIAKAGESLSIQTASLESSCGYPFKTGESYLIYATERNGHLTTGLCSGDKKMSDAASDLAWLASH